MIRKKKMNSSFGIVLLSSHPEVLKEIVFFISRMQSQETLKLTDDAEKDYRKMSDRISENTEIMKVSYAEFIAEEQASASRLCKVAIPELAESLNKLIEALRGRYGIASST